MIKKDNQAPNDNELAKKLYKAFHNNKEFKGYDINVTARDGHVNLQGIVDVLAETKKAVEFASDFPGVKSVENDLTISTDGGIDDDQIYMEITQELGGDPRVDEAKIHFTVNRGIVTLSGETRSHEEREAAAQATAKARGVKRINNQVRIRENEVRRPLFDFEE
jgi:hyperosmotically inducible protein